MWKCPGPTNSFHFKVYSEDQWFMPINRGTFCPRKNGDSLRVLFVCLFVMFHSYTSSYPSCSWFRESLEPLSVLLAACYRRGFHSLLTDWANSLHFHVWSTFIYPCESLTRQYWAVGRWMGAFLVIWYFDCGENKGGMKLPGWRLHEPAEFKRCGYWIGPRPVSSGTLTSSVV